MSTAEANLEEEAGNRTAVKDVSAQHSRWKLFYRGANWVGRKEVFDKKE